MFYVFMFHHLQPHFVTKKMFLLNSLKDYFFIILVLLLNRVVCGEWREKVGGFLRCFGRLFVFGNGKLRIISIVFG